MNSFLQTPGNPWIDIILLHLRMCSWEKFPSRLVWKLFNFCFHFDLQVTTPSCASPPCWTGSSRETATSPRWAASWTTRATVLPLLKGPGGKTKYRKPSYFYRRRVLFRLEWRSFVSLFKIFFCVRCCTTSGGAGRRAPWNAPPRPWRSSARPPPSTSSTSAGCSWSSSAVWPWPSWSLSLSRYFASGRKTPGGNRQREPWTAQHS